MSSLALHGVAVLRWACGQVIHLCFRWIRHESVFRIIPCERAYLKAACVSINCYVPVPSSCPLGSRFQERPCRWRHRRFVLAFGDRRYLNRRLVAASQVCRRRRPEGHEIRVKIKDYSNGWRCVLSKHGRIPVKVCSRHVNTDNCGYPHVRILQKPTFFKVCIYWGS